MPGKLTTRMVDTISSPVTGRKFIGDSEVKGFCAIIYAPTKRNGSGIRSFGLKYWKDGVSRLYTIGNRPTWTVEAARIEAKELRKRIDRGEDPAEDKRERREAPTIKDLIERFKADQASFNRLKGPRRNDAERMLAEIGTELGYSRKVAEVHFGDIQAMHRRITESGRPVRANRIHAMARAMFSLSLRPAAGETKPWRDQAQGNPCKGIERNQEEAKDRFLSTGELAALSDALASDAPGSAADCIKLIMLTGCRPHEAMTAHWEQFDAEPGFWAKLSAHTKQRKVHKVPLNPAALELLDKLRTKRHGKNKSPWVFPGQNRVNAPLKQIHSVWYAARDRATVTLWASSDDKDVAAVVADLRAAGRDPTIEECRAEAARRGVELPVGLTDARPYDLRHTFASVGAGGGLSLQIIGKLLGHTQARTTQRYAHLADNPLREATTKIGGVIAGAGKGKQNVKRLRGTT